MYVLRIYIILDKYNPYLGGEYIRKTAKKTFFLTPLCRGLKGVRIYE